MKEEQSQQQIDEQIEMLNRLYFEESNLCNLVSQQQVDDLVAEHQAYRANQRQNKTQK